MLTVILSILKVVFITLLVLLGILILCIFIALFCPMFYKAEGHKNADSLALHLKGSWFFGIIKVHFDYPKPGSFIVKLLCFTLYDSSKPPQKKEKADKTSRKSDKNQYHPAINTSLLASIEEEEAAEAARTDAALHQTEGASSQMEDASTTATGDSSAEQTGLLEKILCSFRKIYDKIKHIRSEINFYKRLYETSEAQELISRILNKVKRILRAVVPKDLEANILLGTGQPDTTGYAAAAYGMLSPFIGTSVHFTPDFENKIAEGYFKAKGHITVFVLLKNVLSVLLDRNFRIILRRIKKHNAKLNKTVSAG